MTTPPILVLAVGNPSRGDDAIGPLLAARLQEWLALQAADLTALVEVIVDQQLMVEHVMDLAGRTRVLFVDAALRSDTPVALRALATQPQLPLARHVDSHRCTPQQLLSLCLNLLQAPPPASLLTVQGHGFELGAPLSDAAQASLPQAWTCLQSWVEEGLAAVRIG